MTEQFNEVTVKDFTLPVYVRTKAQIHELLKEVLLIDDFFNKAQTQSAGSKLSLPKASLVLDKLTEANDINILHHEQRLDLAKTLRQIYRQAPVVSLYFTEGSRRFVDGIVKWFRSEVDPFVLVHLSANSRVVAGCVIRLRHKTYDFSYQKLLQEKRAVLQQSLTASLGSNLEERVHVSSARTKYF